MKQTPLKRKTWLKAKTPWQRKKKTVSKQRDPYWKAVDRADRWFSRYIRRKAATNDAVRCFTCGAYDDWKKMDAGHYIGRQYMSTRYDERNVHPQCQSCNRFKEGEKDEYAYALIKKYGAEILEELNRAKHLPTRMDEYTLDLIAKEYQEKTKEL